MNKLWWILIAFAIIIIVLVLLAAFLPKTPQYTRAPDLVATMMTRDLTCDRVAEDCLENLKLLWTERAFLERYLIRELLHGQNMSLTLDRIYANSQSIGDDVSCLIQSNVSATVAGSLNAWDNILVKMVDAYITKDNVSILKYTSEMAEREMDIASSIGSKFPELDKQKLVNTLNTYRTAVLAELQFMIKNDIATSYIELDNAKSAVLKIASMLEH